jgi:bifunctional non-homologous end joining protein LigD
VKLSVYKSKRRFDETPEPEPKTRSAGKQLAFVVHKHAARHLHYDLRLELDGVLKSWAVPKGPSLDPEDRRLAMMVEDHPLDYQDFEGIIPAGNYGAGSVIIWDRGVYQHPSAKDRGKSERLLRAGLKKGDFKFILAGEKLKGEFALVRMRKDRRTWLLLKKKDRYATTEPILSQSRSVVSGKTLEDVTATAPPKPFRQKKLRQIRLHEALEQDLREAPVKPMPHHIKPMLAGLARKPFDHPDWVFEMKWDGYRAIAEIRRGEVSLYSRNQILLNREFPPIVSALTKAGFDAALDGEIVVVDGSGQPSFQMLQEYRRSRTGSLLYYVFDLLYLNGHDLTGLPLVRRKKILQAILPSSPRVRISDYVVKEGVLFFRVVKEKGLEGIIAKHSQSQYLMGRRSPQWLKIKARLTQDGVIAGFTAPRGGRSYFGSLVLGAYEWDELSYIGRCGGGFNEKSLKEIYDRLRPLIRKKCPFKQASSGPAVGELRGTTWVKPEVVCEVTFTEWTADGVMRQPVFLRLREDKNAREAVREKPAIRGR